MSLSFVTCSSVRPMSFSCLSRWRIKWPVLAVHHAHPMTAHRVMAAAPVAVFSTAVAVAGFIFAQTPAPPMASMNVPAMISADSPCISSSCNPFE